MEIEGGNLMINIKDYYLENIYAPGGIQRDNDGTPSLDIKKLLLRIVEEINKND